MMMISVRFSSLYAAYFYVTANGWEMRGGRIPRCWNVCNVCI